MANQFNLCTADYYLTLIDSNNCSLTDTFSITSSPQLTIAETITNVNCSGDSTGALSIVVTGGNLTTSTDYTYSWIGINTGYSSTSANISNLVADSYFLTVTDDDGCSDTATYHVLENNALNLITSSIDATCQNSNGEVDVIASGGVVAVDYAYSWSNSSFTVVGATSNVTSLPAGTYMVTVTDDLGCIDSASATINDLSSSSIVIDTIIHESCAGDNDGLISLIITVSPPPGVLTWTGPPGFVDPGGNNTTITNLSAGQYIATLTDGLGCQKQEVINIIAAQTLSLNSIVVDPSCFNFTDGSIDIFPSGGSVAVDYTYDWDTDGLGDLDDQQNLINIASGTYIVFVYDDNGCMISDTFNLNNPAELTGTTSSSFAACGVNDGYVVSTITGGTLNSGTYTYTWIDQSTGLQIGNTDSVGQLPAGCYELTVTDDNACPFIDVTCISNPTGPVITLDFIDSVTCYNAFDGNIFIAVNGGNFPYSYLWSGSPMHQGQVINTQDFISSYAGIFSVVVTDSLGCIASDVFTIPQPDSIIGNGAVITNLTCYNNSSGEIDLNYPIGGTPPYFFSWIGPNGFSSSLEDLINLDTGTYIVSGADNHGCSLPIDTLNITQPDSISLNLTSTQTACDQPTGTATVVASGGTIALDYTYYWLSSIGDTVSILSTATNLDVGVYFAHVFDDNGCLGLDSITIVPFAGPVVSLDTIIDVPCSGAEDGSIFISVAGTASPFNFNWSGTISPDPSHQINEDLITWFAGIYDVIVTDTNGCTDNLTGLLIDQPLQLISNINTTDVLCNGDSTGTLNLTLNGGVLPYQYEWTNGGIIISTVEDPINLPAGTYNLLATDSNGCTITDQAIINESSILTLSGNSINSTCGNTNGEISVSTSGGNVLVDYTYSWFDIGGGYPGIPVGAGNDTVTGLAAGAYQVVVSDDNGCTDSTIVALSDATGPVLTYVSTNIFCFGSANGSINLTATGSGPPFIFSWTGPPPFTDPGTEDLSGLDPGTYTVVVTDTNGCISSEAIDVSSPSGPIQVNSTIINLTCYNDASGEIAIDIIGGTPPYQTSWSGPNGFTSSLEDLTGLDTGQYILDILDANLCELDSSLFNVIQPDSIIIDTTVLDPTCGLADGQIDVFVSGGTVAVDYTYNWDDLSTPSSNIGFTSTLTGVAAGNYQITVTDDNGCMDSTIIAITDLTGPILSAVTTDVDCVGDDDGTINLTITGSGSYVIDWDNDGVGDNDDPEDLIALAAGTYNVVVEDLVTGCVASLSVDINVANSMALSFITTDLICNDDSTGSINATVTGGTPSYLYDWTLGGFTVSIIEDPSGLVAGIYLLTITDDNGCNYVDSIEIFEPADLALTGSSVNSTCGNSNGEVSVVASGGTIVVDYSYSWFDIGAGYPGTSIGSGNDTITGLAAGAYQVIVTDDNGCSDSIAVSVTDANGPVITFTTIDVLCFGDATGEINLSIAGNGGFGFVWTGPSPFTDPGTEDLIGLNAGTYSVVVTDINGCSATENIDILSPSAALSVNSSVTNLLCHGDSTGSIDVLINGGTIPYTTSWSGPNGYNSNSEDISSLDTGQYILNIQDNNGCQLNGTSFNITQPDTLSIVSNITYPTCNASDGQISVSVSGGTVFTDYAYNWDDISTPAFGISSFSTLTGVGAGNYEITVTDDNNCLNSEILSITNVNAPVLSAVVTNIDCNGNSNGAINLTITGTSSYTIDWDNDGVGDNDDTEDLNGLSAGTYSVIINDLSTGCIAALSVDVLEPAILNISGVASNLLCYQDSSGNITVSITGGTLPYLFDWDNDGVGDNDDEEDLDSLLIGNYNLTVLDSNNCSQSASYTISEPSEITVSASIINNLCFGDSLGSINITPSGGNPSYSYEWSNALAIFSLIEDPVNLAADTYFLTITDDSTCVKDTFFTINQPLDINISTVVTPVDCNGNGNGSVNATLTGGTSPLTPFWTIITPGGGLIPGNEDQSTLDGGDYQLLVTDNNGCVDSVQLTINESNTIISNGLVTNISCYDQLDGSIDLNLVGGASPYNISWVSSDPVFVDPGSEDLLSLDSGSYTITVLDDNGCLYDTTLIITKPSEIFANGSLTNLICYNDSSGTITLTTDNGFPNYTWNWTGPAGFTSTNESITGLDAGNYNVTITDDNLCTKDSSFIITSPNPIYLNVVVVDANCAFSDGSATANVSGGTLMSPDYVYDWDNDGVGDNDDANFITSLAAGSYSLIAYDDNGCQADTTININIINGPIITIDSVIHVTCPGGNDGLIYSSVIGGTLPYNYIWNSNVNQQSEDISNLSAGTYYLEIIDGIGCQSYDTIDVQQPNPITITAISNNASCNLCDGTTTITAQGGTAIGGYSYLWASGETGSFADSLCSGIYTVEITDGSGCSVNAEIGISDNGGPLGESVLATDPSCHGSNDGSILVIANGGLAPYTYFWPFNGSVSSNISNLSSGNYFVEITDDNGCTRVTEITLTDPIEINIIPITTPASCGNADGAISLITSGGTGSYFYSWSNSQNTSSINSLFSDIYTVTVTDGVGCQNTETIVLSNLNNLNLSLSETDVTCFGLNNGELISNVSGAIGIVNYSWFDNSGNALSVNTPDLSNVIAGNYILEITDAGTGCIQYSSSTISEPDELMISLPNVLDASCAASCDGEATAVISGGILPYNINWSNGDNTITATSLCAGPSIVTITDNNGCIVEETIVINETLSLSGSAVWTDASCGSCNGQATISPVGGTGNYTITWFDGLNSTNHSNLCAGIYGYEILDMNGCVVQETVIINNIGGPDNEIINSTDVTCNNGADGTASVIPSGGTPPYSYYWVPGGQTSNFISGLQAGLYHLEVIDANGCIRVVPITISEPSTINIQSVVSDANCGNTDGSISLVMNGGSSPYNVNWTGPSGFLNSGENISGLLAGTYSANIQDAVGCINTVLFSVNAINGPDLSITTINASCFGSCDGEATIVASNGSGNYNYSWSNSGNTNTINGLCEGNYSVDVIDVTTGCSSSSFLSILQPDSISLSTPFTISTLCNGSCDGEASIIPSGGDIAYSFTWSPSSGFTSYETGLCAGIHTVTVTDANNCSAIQDILIQEPQTITVNVDNVMDAFCVTNADGSINITTSGGDGNYIYSWSTIPSSSFSSINEDLTSLLPTNYVVSILDGNNCQGGDTIAVDTTHILIANAGLDTALCINDCITITGSGSGTSSFTLEWLDSLNNVVSSADTLVICSSDPSTSNYILQITDQNCTHTDTISVVVNDLPVVDAGVDIIEIYGDIVTLGGFPTGPIGSTVSWSPLTNFMSLEDSNSFNPNIELLTDQLYIVNVTDSNGCISSDDILVTLIPEIYYPTGFTPNSDGINEEWQIDRIEEFPECVVEIYNRWGEMLFRSIGYTEKWDGIYKNKPLPVGTYYYIIELNHPKFPNPYTGPVTIMR